MRRRGTGILRAHPGGGGAFGGFQDKVELANGRITITGVGMIEIQAPSVTINGRPAADALWREAEVFYAVGNQARCDEVRASLGTPTEACWGPVYFRRQ